MAKTKAPKEKKDKKELPVTQAEYTDAQMMVLFVAEVKKVLEKMQGLSDVHFVPKTGGYRVYYKLDGKDYKIAIEKRTLVAGYKVEKFVDGFKKASASFKSPEQYGAVITKIFDGKKAKKEKKK